MNVTIDINATEGAQSTRYYITIDGGSVAAVELGAPWKLDAGWLMLNNKIINPAG